MHPTFPATFDGLLALCAYLRSEDGCPWDAEQTHESLKPMLLEEMYELIDAVDQSDSSGIVEELGDLLYHLIFQMRIGSERGEFASSDVFVSLRDKLIRRHPHVFGEAEVSDSRQVKSRWDEIKRQEKQSAGKSLLEGIPSSMPALAYAEKLGDRSARAGFDWEEIEGALEKVKEELQELRMASTENEREAELGDLLCSITNVARWMNIDPEGALRKTGDKYRRRFAYMEKIAGQRSHDFVGLPLDEKESLWQEAKGEVG